MALIGWAAHVCWQDLPRPAPQTICVSSSLQHSNLEGQIRVVHVGQQEGARTGVDFGRVEEPAVVQQKLVGAKEAWSVSLQEVDD